MRSGDTTYFYIPTENGEEDRKILNFFKADFSRESAWQLYLLYRSETVLPTMWHGGYIQRHFIFNEKDINSIKPLKNYDMNILSRANLLLPEVIINQEDKTADVYCTYWNYWEGLIREHIKIHFLQDLKIKVEKLDPLILFEYRCDILF